MQTFEAYFNGWVDLAKDIKNSGLVEALFTTHGKKISTLHFWNNHFYHCVDVIVEDCLKGQKCKIFLRYVFTKFAFENMFFTSIN